MNEHELKSALQEVMVASSPPPPMSPGAALDHARRVQRRRKTAVGGAFAGLAVVAIAVGAVMVPNLTGGAGVGVAGQQSDSWTPTATPTGVPFDRPSVTATAPPAVPSGVPSATGSPGSKTSAPWPDGQTDRTATSGPRADKGAELLNDLASSLPAGVKAEDRQRLTSPDYGPMTRHQAQFADYVGDLQVWEYDATTPLVLPGEPGVGELAVRVYTRGTDRFGDSTGCAAATRNRYPVSGGSCELVAVGNAQVAVVTGAEADSTRNTVESAAFYRHPDGAWVVVTYSGEYPNSGHPALSRPALTAAQLAALAADPEFHLD